MVYNIQKNKPCPQTHTRLWNINTITRNKTLPINNYYGRYNCSVKHSYRNRGDRSDGPVRHREMDDPSVYAKRSFPLSIVNTRQTPRRVTSTFASQRDICRGGSPTNPAEYITNKWNADWNNGFQLGPRDVPWSICPFLHCGPPNAVPRHTGLDWSPRMANVQNVVRITKLSYINSYHNNTWSVSSRLLSWINVNQ